MKRLILAVALLSIALAACTGNIPTSIPSDGSSTGSASQTGSAYFGVSDAAVKDASSVQLDVDSLEVHTSGGAWTSVDLNETSFDLLALNASGETALMAQADLDPGTYDQVRLHVSSVTVTDENGTHDAKLPSGELKLQTQLRVRANESSSAELDFRVNDSLHRTGNGEYILTPVIQTRTRERVQAQVAQGAQGVALSIQGGTRTHERTEGMGVDGKMRDGVQVRAGANVSIENGKLTVTTPAGKQIGVDIGVSAGGNANSGQDSGGSGNADAGAGVNVNANGKADVNV